MKIPLFSHIKPVKPLLILAFLAVMFLVAVNHLPELRNFKLGIFDGEVVWRSLTFQKEVALTIDDGPDPHFTPQILAILKRYRIPAAFFVVGANVAAHPELVRAELAAGYLIGNHTWDHPHLKNLPTNRILAEIRRTDLQILNATGIEPSIFRPPYLELSPPIIKAARQTHKTIILSVLTVERSSIKDPVANADRLVRQVYPGAIILAHDGRLDRSQTVLALPYVITKLQSAGFRFVSLSELLRRNF